MSSSTPIVAAYQSLLAKGRLQPNAAQGALVQQLSHLQQSLLSKHSRINNNAYSRENGVYIYGGVGTGKSRIADLFAATLPQNISKRRIHFHQFMVDVHMRLHRARSEASDARDPLIRIGQQICAQSSVLCFDEFQVSDIADAMILKRLFGSFWESGGVMVSTSNRHPTELYLNGLNRPLFISFIKELQDRCLVWKMDGEHDYRMDIKDHGCVAVFFTDEQAFSASLRDAAGPASLETVRIEVLMNRSISLLASQNTDQQRTGLGGGHKKVVSGTFAELCEASRGTTDYHALCDFAHTIYISNLHPFAVDGLDYLRRFITLIDIAYESRTRVICLASSALSELFVHVGIAPATAVAEFDARSGDKAAPTGHLQHLDKSLTVKKEGGSSSSMMSTFIDNVEWSATGLTKASLATGGAGETDVRFAVGRAISRLSEMGSARYGIADGDDCGAQTVS